jgi:hypothetical protein
MPTVRRATRIHAKCRPGNNRQSTILPGRQDSRGWAEVEPELRSGAIGNQVCDKHRPFGCYSDMKNILTKQDNKK